MAHENARDSPAVAHGAARADGGARGPSVEPGQAMGALVSFENGDNERVAVIYHSKKRGLFVAIDEASGRELCSGVTPEKVSYQLFEELKAAQVKHCYLHSAL